MPGLQINIDVPDIAAEAFYTAASGLRVEDFEMELRRPIIARRYSNALLRSCNEGAADD